MTAAVQVSHPPVVSNSECGVNFAPGEQASSIQVKKKRVAILLPPCEERRPYIIPATGSQHQRPPLWSAQACLRLGWRQLAAAPASTSSGGVVNRGWKN